MNGRADHCHSLAQRLGFNLNEEYYAFLIVAGLAKCVENKRTNTRNIACWVEAMIGSVPELELDKKKFDLDSLMKGEKEVEKHWYDFHVIRIGEINDDSYTIVTHQIREEAALSNLPGLLSMQQSLCRNVRRMTYDVIFEDQDLFDVLAIEYEIDKNRRAREKIEATAARLLGKRQREDDDDGEVQQLTMAIRMV